MRRDREAAAVHTADEPSPHDQVDAPPPVLKVASELASETNEPEEFCTSTDEKKDCASDASCIWMRRFHPRADPQSAVAMNSVLNVSGEIAPKNVFR
jgi:hypothetical protein